MRKSKKAIFFSTDALIAITIIIAVMLLAFPAVKFSKRDTQIHQDILKTLSALQLSEADNTYLQSLISQGIINDTNKTVLEQIGEFYVTDVALARNLASSILSEVETNKNIGLWFVSDSGQETLVFSSNSTPMETAENVQTARQVISGIQEGGSVTGFSARAFLTSGLVNQYHYFGGYFGDGNISIRSEYSGNLSSATLELAINNGFEIFVNGISNGTLYPKSNSEFIPASYVIPIENFNSGVNSIEFRGSNLHIAGGFIKLAYTSSSLYEQPSRYYFPGIRGLINVYDGFYVPSDLDSLEISLHLDTSHVSFLTIGNTTVFKNFTQGEQTILIPNAQLQSLLDYQEISKETIPIRLGLENVSFVTNTSLIDIDAMSVTDISGSMSQCAQAPDPPLTCSYSCVFGGSKVCSVNTIEECAGNICGGFCFLPFEHSIAECTALKLDLAKQANNIFIDAILNFTENRVGLVGYEESAADSNYHELSNNSASLKTQVSDWIFGGATCICCGINRAVSGILANSSAERAQSMVVMSDGQANRDCGMDPVPDHDNDGDTSEDPEDHAIEAACIAYNTYNITVHSIGFGNDTDETTLQQIAQCGNGDYYFGDVNELVSIYQQIAQNIIEAQFVEQTIESSGNVTTILYSDSYIEFNYTKQTPPFGLIITKEKRFDNNFSGTVEIPGQSTLVETRATSYSGPRWTDQALINNNLIYNISEYGIEYIKIGDPFVVHIPNSLINQNNTINITTGISPLNSTSGSEYNKIISTIVKNASPYSQISQVTTGCIWTIEFEDFTNITIPIPSSYSGTDLCLYTSSSQQYNNNDAAQNSIFELLQILDLDLNNQIEVKFSEQDLQLELTEITGIPYTWSTEVQARTWF